MSLGCGSFLQGLRAVLGSEHLAVPSMRELTRGRGIRVNGEHLPLSNWGCPQLQPGGYSFLVVGFPILQDNKADFDAKCPDVQILATNLEHCKQVYEPNKNICRLD